MALMSNALKKKKKNVEVPYSKSRPLPCPVGPTPSGHSAADIHPGPLVPCLTSFPCSAPAWDPAGITQVLHGRRTHRPCTPTWVSHGHSHGYYCKVV